MRSCQPDSPAPAAFLSAAESALRGRHAGPSKATQTAGGLPSMAVGGLPSWAAVLLVRATASVRRVTAAAAPGSMASLDEWPTLTCPARRPV
jgi:hypothetical protein